MKHFVQNMDVMKYYGDTKRFNNFVSIATCGVIT